MKKLQKKLLLRSWEEGRWGKQGVCFFPPSSSFLSLFSVERSKYRGAAGRPGSQTGMSACAHAARGAEHPVSRRHHHAAPAGPHGPGRPRARWRSASCRQCWPGPTPWWHARAAGGLCAAPDPRCFLLMPGPTTENPVTAARRLANSRCVASTGAARAMPGVVLAARLAPAHRIHAVEVIFRLFSSYFSQVFCNLIVVLPMYREPLERGLESHHPGHCSSGNGDGARDAGAAAVPPRAAAFPPLGHRAGASALCGPCDISAGFLFVSAFLFGFEFIFLPWLLVPSLCFCFSFSLFNFEVKKIITICVSSLYRDFRFLLTLSFNPIVHIFFFFFSFFLFFFFFLILLCRGHGGSRRWSCARASTPTRMRPTSSAPSSC